MGNKKSFIVTVLVSIFFICGAGQAFAAQYTVKPGDSLYLISQRFGTSVNTLKSTNGLKSNTIYPGQVLTVPDGTGNYVVKSGDSLYKISRNFNTTVEYLKNINGLKSTYIYPGQVLKVPSAGFNYVVKKGDTLYLLAKKFGVTVASIKSINGLKSDYLYVGQNLYIRTGTSGNTNSRTYSSASRGASSYSRSEVMLLARLINGEARGESYTGQVAVGAVVLNRVDSPLFPNTISGVIYQPNEFSVVNDGQINLTPSQTAIKAAEDAMNGWDPSNGALYYWNPAKSPNNKFLNSRPIVARIGNHVFAK
ncbi:MAG: LysM peptidoglycan-binding domain-containing protein [Bacillota bacterium]|jgi:N-acetylmuramoyl-L-alanine amidase|nr:LysM peptidoglycan-binding domain-containing protein [Clostridia bacterium]